MKDCKTIKIEGKEFQYKEVGSGRPILLLHGIASTFFTWKHLIEHVEGDFKFIMLDLKGESEGENGDDLLYPYEQAQIVINFIKKLDLEDIVVVGHAMGGTIAMLSLFDKSILERVSNLVLIDSAGMFLKFPDFVLNFLGGVEEEVLLRYSKSKKNLLPNMILKEFYFDSNKITQEAIDEYSKLFDSMESKKYILASLRQFPIANFYDFYNRLQSLKVNTLIIWGEEDRIIDIEEAFNLKNAIQHSELKIIPQCGHCPHEETPIDTAKEILTFIGASSESIDHLEEVRKESEAKIPKNDASKSTATAPLPLVHNIKMSRLFKGNWNLISIIFFVIIKILQIFRKYSGAAKKNGWRKITEIFLRKEHSKFCLASFRLKYENGENPNRDFNRAKILLIAKLFKFIKNSPILHWSVEQHAYSVKKKANGYVDIMLGEFDNNGKLLSIESHFEIKKDDGVFILGASKLDKLEDIIINSYNETRDLHDKKRLKALNHEMNKAIKSKFSDVSDQITMRHYGLRVLQSTFIYFERTIEDNKLHLSKERLATPNFFRLKHPGAGLLNIYCRFSPDLVEADLWFQYHHVPVDGMPMQEMLEKLKEEWGAAGPVIYPPVGSDAGEGEIIFAGDGMYRGKLLCDFSEILKFRKVLNNEYYNEMSGAASLPALLMWGIANHPNFKGYKFTMPVDTALLDGKGEVHERNISLIFIQPKMFFDDSLKFGGLIKFIQEFNRLIAMTRIGKSESYEFIELAGIMNPVSTAMLQKFLPNTFSNVIGNGGLTIIRDAEMFITPLTELQQNGFIAIGNCRMKTSDDKFGGFVSVCGDEKLVESYLETLKMVTTNFTDYLPEDSI